MEPTENLRVVPECLKICFLHRPSFLDSGSASVPQGGVTPLKELQDCGMSGGLQNLSK
ncbi:uncharacterized protein PHALS_13538 [Plasmopara halstedii]|uniref:Uncharacterized protein n=1 Tax=Plasmopara halstedii TaxID=4781 RepID=A0A0P1APW5_PLAHL|nr:uncharacterized protein PHALS_13538 [Plasmopara halstedii]CEG43337.1 hypothetical protein PHALS_13538 [Plasmopara halstedii]|eukprot:XP_024579706.1 hypothetical protein PHALS_13538 [Plasmopara halstedii]